MGNYFTTNFRELLSMIDSRVSVTLLDHREKHLLETVKKLQADGILFTGSSRRISRVTEYILPTDIMELGIPILGICYGFQWMVWKQHGKNGTFQDKKLHEYHRVLEITGPFSLSKRKYAFSHHDYINELPNSWTKSISWEDQIWMAYEKETGHIGIQFHPELHFASTKAFFTAWFQWLKKYQKER
jgi:GMP synthase (glutamine-hydrolysing)